MVSQSLRVAGNVFDQDIVRYVRHKENLLIGDRTAEEAKRVVGAAVLKNGEENLSMEIRGRDLINGMPKTVEITTQDMVIALKDSLDKIADGVRKVLEQAPPELVSDVIQRGIVITGGGAKLRNLDVLLGSVTSIPVFVAENSEDCVVIGTGKALEMSHVLEDARNKVSWRR